jgi:carbon storage regulator
VLVLSRRIGERLRLGPDIELIVLDVRGREVRLGVVAPASIPIYREEIYVKVQASNRAAALGQAALTDAVARAARELRASSVPTCAHSSAR